MKYAIIGLALTLPCASARAEICTLLEQDKLMAAQEACFVDKDTPDLETERICSRVYEAVGKQYDCLVREAARKLFEEPWP